MIHTHLQRYAMTAPPVFGVEHLDEDALSAFVGGELSEREAAPLVTHLVNCAQCRHTTAELTRLQDEFADEPIARGELAPASDAQRSRLRRFLDAISASITPDADDGAVFAYHEPETEDEERNNPEHSDAHDGDSPEKK